jgi:hypothetical protein
LSRYATNYEIKTSVRVINKKGEIIGKEKMSREKAHMSFTYERCKIRIKFTLKYSSTDAFSMFLFS